MIKSFVISKRISRYAEEKRHFLLGKCLLRIQLHYCGATTFDNSVQIREDSVSLLAHSVLSREYYRQYLPHIS